MFGIIFTSPVFRAAILALAGICANLFAGSFVFEITKIKDGQQFLDWSVSLHTYSLWFLMVIFMITTIYGIQITRSDEAERRRFLTDADVRQELIKELIKPTIEQARRDIKSGRFRSVDELAELLSPRSPDHRDGR